MLGFELALLLGRGEDADAKGLGEIEHVTHLGGVVLLDGTQRHYTGHREAEDGFGGIDTVTTGQGNARLVTHLTTAVDHLLGHFRRERVDGPAEDGDGDDGLAAHGIDVADSVGGGDATEGEGVIDDGHEEVGGGDDALTVADVHHGGVILAAVADDQGRIVKARDLALQNGVEHLGGDFAATARAVAVLGQTNGRHAYPLFVQTVQRLCGAVKCALKRVKFGWPWLPWEAAMSRKAAGQDGEGGATWCASAAPPRATGRGIMPQMPSLVRTGIHTKRRVLVGKKERDRPYATSWRQGISPCVAPRASHDQVGAIFIPGSYPACSIAGWRALPSRRRRRCSGRSSRV
ncbi:hypothetical protein D3C76_534110 [compost metagenome]